MFELITEQIDTIENAIGVEGLNQVGREKLGKLIVWKDDLMKSIKEEG